MPLLRKHPWNVQPFQVTLHLSHMVGGTWSSILTRSTLRLHTTVSANQTQAICCAFWNSRRIRSVVAEIERILWNRSNCILHSPSLCKSNSGKTLISWCKHNNQHNGCAMLGPTSAMPMKVNINVGCQKRDGRVTQASQQEVTVRIANVSVSWRKPKGAQIHQQLLAFHSCN